MSAAWVGLITGRRLSDLLAAGNADMTLGIACRLCWAMGHGPDAVENAVFAEWHAQPGVAEWQHKELDRRRLQQKLESLRARIADYQSTFPPAVTTPRRWLDGGLKG